MPGDYNSYIKQVTDDITTCIETLGLQPIIFVGSGLSRRYFGAPNWEELLLHLAMQCPEIKREYAYYKQSYRDPIDIGAIFAEYYKEWAWGEGRSLFDDALFEYSQPSEIYLKTKIAEYFKNITPNSSNFLEQSPYKGEIELLRRMSPFSIITTNYDSLLELVFPNYQPVVGQQIIKANYVSVGEILKIHGSDSEPDSIVITRKDYDYFMAKKKYLSAKLLTYFAEHPLLFIGYRAEDPNIKSILSDIDEVLSNDEEIIPNIYILEWNSAIKETSFPATEKVISIEGAKSIRVKSITASSFDWVFKAFGSCEAIENVRPEILRALLARTYNLVRQDIPRKSLEIDYQVLERALGDVDGLAKLYGIAVMGNDPIAVNANYQYCLQDIGIRLGYSGWHQANQLLDRLRREVCFDIKTSDNKYHIALKTGAKSISHKYSEELLNLLMKMKNNESYEFCL